MVISLKIDIIPSYATFKNKFYRALKQTLMKK